MNTDTDLIPQVTVAQMVDSYNHALKQLDQAYEMLGEAQSRLKAAFGDYGPDVWYSSSAGYNHRRTCDEIKKEMLKTAWKSILSRLDLDKITTQKQADAIRERIEKTPPALTIEEVTRTLMALAQNLPNLTHEYLEDVYQMLRPNNHWKHYKTNNTPGIGNKVILTWTVEHKAWGGGFRVLYGQHEDKLNRIERAFYFLDGKPYPHPGYKSFLVDAINTSGHGGEGSTEYFEFKCCQNGNLHLTFKRHDLTKILDGMFGGITLKEGQKVYNQSTFA